MAGDPLEHQERVRRTLAPVSRVVPVVGAGVSQGAGLDGAQDLADPVEGLRPLRRRKASRLEAFFTVVDRLDPEWANEHLRTTLAPR